MLPSERLEQAIHFAEMHNRRSAASVEFWMSWWLDSKQFAAEDAEAIRGYVGRLMAGEDPEGMISTNLEQTAEAV